jgi:hypothetical protein
MRRAREGRETKRVSFSLRNCMFATLHVALTTARKDCRLSHRCTSRPYVHPISPVQTRTGPRSSPKFEPRSHGSARSGCTHSRLPTGPLRTACWEPRMHPRAALDEHLLLEPAVCSARLADSSHLPRRAPPQALRSRLEDAPLEQVMALVCRVKEGCRAGRT